MEHVSSGGHATPGEEFYKDSDVYASKFGYIDEDVFFTCGVCPPPPPAYLK